MNQRSIWGSKCKTHSWENLSLAVMGEKSKKSYGLITYIDMKIYLGNGFRISSMVLFFPCLFCLGVQVCLEFTVPLQCPLFNPWIGWCQALPGGGPRAQVVSANQRGGLWATRRGQLTIGWSQPEECRHCKDWWTSAERSWRGPGPGAQRGHVQVRGP